MVRIYVGTLAILCLVSQVQAQNFERYRPQILVPRPVTPPRLQDAPEPASGSDRQLLDRLDAVVILDHADQVDPEAANDDLEGVISRSAERDSLTFSTGFHAVVSRHIGQPVSLRSLNQLSQEIIKYYHRCKRPVVDVQIPEQRITGGTVQIVVVESRVGRVVVGGACHFDNCELGRWAQCTRRGGRIYDPWIANDLFWLNQSPFREVDVDLQPGAHPGTTDVHFQVTDVTPVRAYLGYDDTGVKPLGRERLMAGVIFGNVFSADDLLSYQYTTDGDTRLLHAHAATYSRVLNRDYSYNLYGSWAGVTPSLGGGLTQNGESWITGLSLNRHLRKDYRHDEFLTAGFEFKSTNNNLEFGGQNVQTSSAELAQIHLGYSNLYRGYCDEYNRLRADVYVGPGPGFSPGANAVAFGTIRADTSPDYVYARINYEEAVNIDADNRFQFVFRGTGQVASERLLPSETLGVGGFDSVRGYDQRTTSGDHGWLTSLEVGPRPADICVRGQKGRLRYYTFADLGQSFVEDQRAGDVPDLFLASVGVGMQASLGDDLSLRLDYGYGLKDIEAGATGQPNDRLHIGLVWQIGPRP